MLILHPKSTCDVCFDSYVSSERVPYVIKCGHILCENCINKLPEPSICPFCRMPFDRDEEQLRLHIDTATNALSTPLLIRRSEVSLSESATQAQQYLSRITDIVLGGAKAVEVRELIDEIGEWFSDQEEEFRELQTAWLLLKKHSQKKSDLRQCLEDKKELEQQVEFQKNVSDTVQKRLEKYKESNMKMEEQLAELEKERDQLEQ
ncbi:hypothetical protein QCA50_005440 [Cerrena zonata]|uniref:RING-type domain-containing protein n=1 Tax=Cerrena zonata TaxID=2478898 RepID=A0AAW0GS11_9APHY